jgi:tetratricopeptide (TPR) repeat protein
MSIEQRTFVDLESVGSNNWFNQLGKEIPGFEQLCEILGERFVAFAFISGIRVSAISYDRENPDGSLVDYYDEDGKHFEQVRLSAFRERLTNALLADTQQPINLPEKPTVSDIRLFIGHKYLLLAPIFGITVLGFYFGGAKSPSVFLEIGDSEEELTINGFRDVLEESVRSELSRSRSDSAFSIDFKNIPEAEAANAVGDYEHTIELLGTWPGPLSMFLRTQEGQMLGELEKATLADALGILGKAYLETRQMEWAEDVLRLGVQWGQDSDRLGDLYLLLAEARLSDERYGEAIGLLRRALVVGASKLVVLPQLARCYAKRKRYVAAAICIDEAISNDVDPESIKEIRDEVHQVLGEAYKNFRKKVPLEEP